MAVVFFVSRRARAVASLLVLGASAAVIGLGCGSSSGAKCPDGDGPPKEPAHCPVCPPAPRAPGPPLAIKAETMPIDREQRLTLVGFTADGATALLRVEDDDVGDFFKTVDLSVSPVPKLVKTWMFQSLTEPVAYKQALRALKPQAPGPASQKNAAGVTLLATDAGDHIEILVMKGERAVVIATIPRLKDDDGVLADVSVTKLAWDPTGTRALVIHAQKLAAAPGFESSWLHVIPVDAAALPF